MKSKQAIAALLMLVVVVVAVVAQNACAALGNYHGQQGDVVVREDLPYVDGTMTDKQKLDLFLPAKSNGSAAAIVVFVHGGFWSAQDRVFLRFMSGLHSNVGFALAKQGIPTAVISYRQNPDAKSFAESIDDVVAAVRYARANASQWGGDPQRVYLVGHSAGAHLTSLLALSSDEWTARDTPPVQGVVALAGSYDAQSTIDSVKPDQAAVLRRLWGPDEAALKRSSPLHQVREEHIPLLVVEAGDDEDGLRAQFAALKNALVAAGSRAAAFHSLAGHSHMDAVMRMNSSDDQITPLVASFVGR